MEDKLRWTVDLEHKIFLKEQLSLCLLIPQISTKKSLTLQTSFYQKDILKEVSTALEDFFMKFKIPFIDHNQNLGKEFFD